MTRILTISSAGGSLTLDGTQRVRLGLKFRGAGMPPVANQFFEGAGDGVSYRGGRALQRVLDIPIKVYANARSEVQETLSLISRIFATENAPVSLSLAIDGEAWGLQVVRTGGGDWEWGVDTDGETFLKMIVTAGTHGSPYWRRQNAESRVIAPGGLGLGLLAAGQSLTELILSNMEGSGTVVFENSGDVRAFPIWRIVGPIEAFTLALGHLSLTWTGDAPVGPGDWIEIDTAVGTVVDQDGENRYGELGPAPKFWRIPQGSSTAEVLLVGATGDTRVNVYWNPLRLAVF